MGWTSPYIVIRVTESGSANILKESSQIKDARYYLQYISQPGDAIFLTPQHPKYKGSGTPEYQAHLQARGVIEYDEKKWHELARIATGKLVFAE